MKAKAITIMLGILLCSSTQAEWVKFGTNNEGPLYYDSESIVYMLDGKASIREKLYSMKLIEENLVRKITLIRLQKMFLTARQNNIKLCRITNTLLTTNT
jgi:hypothetical protein